MEKTMLRGALAGVTIASLCVSTAIFAQGGGNGQGGTGGGNAHGAATSGMTHWGDPVESPKNAMSSKLRSQGTEKNNASMDSMSPNNTGGATKTGQ